MIWEARISYQHIGYFGLSIRQISGSSTSPFTPNFLAWWNQRLHGEDSQIPEGLQRYNPSKLKDGIILGDGPYLEDHPSYIVSRY